MNASAGLIALAARRFLAPGALALFAGALALAALLPWVPSAASGASELSPEVGAGLARQGVWLTALAVMLPWFSARAAWCVRNWRHGEGDWLGTGTTSRAGVAACHAAGAGLALAVALAPFAVVAEVRAGMAPRLGWIADASVPPVVLLAEDQPVEVSVDRPRRAEVLRARFVLAAPGNGGPRAEIRAVARGSDAGATASEAKALVTGNTPLEVEPALESGRVSVRFERIGPGAIAVLEDSRLSWFEKSPARWRTSLALYLHAWLVGAALCALVLAVRSWASAATTFLAVIAALSWAWLGERPPLALPGVALGDALSLCGDGLAPALPALATWLGAACACAASLGLVALQRDLWRRDA